MEHPSPSPAPKASMFPLGAIMVYSGIHDPAPGPLQWLNVYEVPSTTFSNTYDSLIHTSKSWISLKGQPSPSSTGAPSKKSVKSPHGPDAKSVHSSSGTSS